MCLRAQVSEILCLYAQVSEHVQVSEISRAPVSIWPMYSGCTPFFVARSGVSRTRARSPMPCLGKRVQTDTVEEEISQFACGMQHLGGNLVVTAIGDPIWSDSNQQHSICLQNPSEMKDVFLYHCAQGVVLQTTLPTFMLFHPNLIGCAKNVFSALISSSFSYNPCTV